eukprot:TRINITY_DN402_c0_g1_i6.p1 TRINITY_DN402_c0_g1~~TRINITY_DN402_c0_g1_i6.p1  ORF type:complete len:498 (+),score=89.47 TRINITY_DN402_c0_g1_i6:54-1547(+)
MIVSITIFISSLLVSVVRGVPTYCSLSGGLGIASNYNGFFAGSFYGIKSDVQGRLGVGGDAFLQNYGVADRLFPTSTPNKCPTPSESSFALSNYSLVVGGALTISNSNIFYGGAAWGSNGGISITQTHVGSSCPFKQASVLDFSSANSVLTAASGNIASVSTPTSVVATNAGELQLRLNGNIDFEVFVVPASQLQSASSVKLVGTPKTGASIIIRVTGGGQFVFKNKSLFGFSNWAGKVLWAFDSTFSKLQITAVQWWGSILAVNADVSATQGEIHGSVFAKSWNVDHSNSIMQIDNVPYSGGVVTLCSTATPTAVPTAAPTRTPTALPTSMPTHTPTQFPTALPTETPTAAPSAMPTEIPTTAPTAVPTAVPTTTPTAVPTLVPTAFPTAVPTPLPTDSPSAVPTALPTYTPTAVPTALPTDSPTAVPTNLPTDTPTALPTALPTNTPTAVPTALPTDSPTVAVPTNLPTDTPTALPTALPTNTPTAVPSSNCSAH